MTRFKRLLNNALLLVGFSWPALFACACAPGDPMRLGREAVPVSQEIALDINADRDGYTGKVTIELEVRRKTDTIGFHASEMDLESVVLDGPAGPIKLSPGEMRQ